MLETLILDTLQNLLGHLCRRVLRSDGLAAVIEVKARLLDILEGCKALLLAKNCVCAFAQSPHVIRVVGTRSLQLIGLREREVAHVDHDLSRCRDTLTHLADDAERALKRGVVQNHQREGT